MDSMTILETPGGQAYMKRSMKALSEGWNVVLIVPDPLRTPEFLEEAKRKLRSQGGPGMISVDVSGLRTRDGLSELMAELPGVDRKLKRKQFADFFRPSASDYMKVTAFTGFEGLPADFREVAGRELASAAEASHEGPGGGQGREGMRYLALVRPGFPQLGDFRGVKVFPWWGSASSVDSDLLFEQAAADCTLDETVYWWLKALCAGVCGDDPSLISRIVENVPRTLGQVREILADHPLAKLIPPDFAFKAAYLYPGISPTRSDPPDRGQDLELWAAGLLSPGRYSLYHPALLSAEGAPLASFISRGQRDVLFPLVDQVHGAVVDILENTLGTGVWEHYIKDPDVRDSAMREIGPLFRAMKEYIRPRDSGQWIFVRELSVLPERWRDIRHLAAHSRVLEYRTFERAVECYSKYRERHMGSMKGLAAGSALPADISAPSGKLIDILPLPGKVRKGSGSAQVFPPPREFGPKRKETRPSSNGQDGSAPPKPVLDIKKVKVSPSGGDNEKKKPVPASQMASSPLAEALVLWQAKNAAAETGTASAHASAAFSPAPSPASAAASPEPSSVAVAASPAPVAVASLAFGPAATRKKRRKKCSHAKTDAAQELAVAEVHAPASPQVPGIMVADDAEPESGLAGPDAIPESAATEGPAQVPDIMAPDGVEVDSGFARPEAPSPISEADAAFPGLAPVLDITAVDDAVPDPGIARNDAPPAFSEPVAKVEAKPRTKAEGKPWTKAEAKLWTKAKPKFEAKNEAGASFPALAPSLGVIPADRGQPDSGIARNDSPPSLAEAVTNAQVPELAPALGVIPADDVQPDSGVAKPDSPSAVFSGPDPSLDVRPSGDVLRSPGLARTDSPSSLFSSPDPALNIGPSDDVQEAPRRATTSGSWKKVPYPAWIDVPEANDGAKAAGQGSEGSGEKKLSRADKRARNRKLAQEALETQKRAAGGDGSSS
ncbi:MAG: hypothetical protein LBT40_13850 [Deltaproteobacteria bacterium]|jgi:hypothetical protein|nr:hypothetical protein [Deltaproteobacteria bacterium]